ncbi:uncharacterized protein C8orf74 homolog isoform X2 [Chiloscyllium plagiosum]|uniref:uncharacterized protein C8orf74 homolog isoform X2 n=1 Tax=Chiloscyllium plagiosum TaxID=36176 RepID=UPI001CB7E4E5|nr:uncharacterized protein C8orf74 homolog isoform X2 [Chiloscyllium plagiosum]
MSSLKVSDVKQVARLQKEAGRCNLVKLLKWEDFDEEKDLKPGILLDYLYNAIIFAAGKGFPWPSVALAAQFSEELLFETEDIPPLKDGIDTELWKHQRYMTELSMAEAQLQADMSAFRENMQLKNEQELEKFYEDLKFQDKEMIERANLEKLVKNAHDIQIMVASEILQKEIETAFQILDLKIQKTTTALPGSKSSRSFTKEMKTKRMSIKK